MNTYLVQLDYRDFIGIYLLRGPTKGVALANNQAIFGEGMYGFTIGHCMGISIDEDRVFLTSIHLGEGENG